MKSIEEFIGIKSELDEFGGTYIYGIHPNNQLQLIAEVRGYGAIQNLFKDRHGKVNFKKADKFQDQLGKWIAEAITEKLERSNPETRKPTQSYGGPIPV